MTTATASPVLHFLEDRWNPAVAATLDEPELLRYRSNLLGSDLRITNFAGGNTSSKIMDTDPLTGKPVEVLWVKGSGGDLGSIKRTGFATLYLDKLLALERKYKGVDTEDEMAAMYSLCSFKNNPVAASIDTPLHGFLPFPHVDHLHPDWGIALAASANGKAKMDEFNREFGHRLVWVPWQRPGFELAMMMKRAVEENPGCDGIVLGGHGLFTWGQTQRECYLNTLTVIDQLGQFIERHGRKGHGAVRRRSGAGAGRPQGTGGADRAVPAWTHQRQAQVHLRLQRRCGCHAIRRFSKWAGDGVSGHELPGPLYSYQDPAAVCAVGRGRGFERAEKPNRLLAGGLSQPIPRLLQDIRDQGFAGDSRRQPYGGADSRDGHVQLRQEQDRGAHHGRVLYQRHSRDGGCEPAGRW